MRIYLLLKFTVPHVITIKAKVLLSQAYVTLAYFSYPVYALWFYCSQGLLNDLAFQSFVPDEGYSSNVPNECYSSNVPDEGYSRNASCALNVISTLLFMYIS